MIKGILISDYCEHMVNLYLYCQYEKLIGREIMRKLVMFVMLLVLIIPASYAATKEVEVIIPGFDVTINENIIDNNTEKYPFIQYNGITYIPMTWDLSYALGLELKWSDVEGLKVNKRDKMQVYVQKEKVVNNTGGRYKAAIVTFPVFVNGEEVENSSNEYPLLNFRNVTYFPMTFDYMVGEFDSGYKWSNDTGLKVSVDPTLEVFIPEPYYVRLKVTAKEMAEKGLLFNEMLYIETVEGDDNDYIKVYSNMNNNYHGYYYNVNVIYYDKDNKIQYINPLIGGEIYESESGKSVAITQFGIFRDGFMNEAYKIIEIEFLPISVARADFRKKYTDVLYEYYDENTIDLEYIKSLDAKYIRGDMLLGSIHLLPDDLLPYAAALSLDGYKKEGSDELYNIYRLGNGTVEFADMDKNYVQVSKLTKLFVKTEELNDGIKCYAGDLLLDEMHKGVIRLYDKDKKLFKILLNKAEVDQARKY